MSKKNKAGQRAVEAVSASRSEKRGLPARIAHGVLAPWRLLKQLFFSDLQLERRNGQLHIVLDSTSSRSSEQPARRKPALSEIDEKMYRALKAVLKERPEAREVLKHLFAFGSALRQRGSKALHEVPLELLRRAHSQLEGLVYDWSSEGLATLRSKMAVAIIERDRTESSGYGPAFASEFNVPGKLEVQEVSVSVFRELAADTKPASLTRKPD